MTEFIGDDEQLMNCLEIIANQKSCSARNAGIILAAADRIDTLKAELAARTQETAK